jgi:hypothetical protein
MQYITSTEEAPNFLYSYRLNADGSGTALDVTDVQNWTPDYGNIWVHIDVADTGTC